MQIEQTKAYIKKDRRMHIATRLIDGATYNMLKNMKYYDNRGKDTSEKINAIRDIAKASPMLQIFPHFMGIEGNCRQVYYSAFDAIIPEFSMGNRTKQPPDNEINALISFGNMVAYTLTLDMIYHTQLNPTISFLHEPGYRRYSLALGHFRSIQTHTRR
jgi:CRISPR-associated protein Cas1